MLTVRWLSTVLFLAICCLATIGLCAEDYYKVLGVTKQATETEIKRAYRKLSKDFHPDRNPDNKESNEKFLAVSDAYSTLSDNTLREIYDRYGHDGILQHQKSGGRAQPRNPFDIFEQFFGGGGGGGSNNGRKRGPNREVQIELPLRNFYTGTIARFSLSKQVVCNTCSGTGSKDKQLHKCDQCNGAGMRIHQVQLAPGIVQRMQSPCQACAGTGHRVLHPCPTCQGQRVVSEHEEHTITVQPGMPVGVTITLENEADESPDWEAGDLIVKLAQKAPSLSPETESEELRTDGTFFRRRGSNLVWREVLGLREAWMGGWSRDLTHLDGHTVKLGRSRGQVVQPGAVEIINGEGMPLWDAEGHEDGHGDLVVEYVIVLPDQMESGMEKEFWSVWEKWRKKVGVNWNDDRAKVVDEGLHQEL